MKSILYVGASLMIGASIYGFVDYRNASQKKEFTTMYHESEVKEPVIPEPAIVAVEKKETTPVKTIVKKSGSKPVPKETKTAIAVTPLEKLATEPVTIKTPTMKENSVPAKIRKTKKRKLDHKLFSRAPLREDYIEKEVKPEKPKKEVVKQ